MKKIFEALKFFLKFRIPENFAYGKKLAFFNFEVSFGPLYKNCIKIGNLIVYQSWIKSKEQRNSKGYVTSGGVNIVTITKSDIWAQVRILD